MYLCNQEWDTGLLEAFLSLVGDSEWGPLTVGGVDDMQNGRGGKVPDGLRYHVLDVWIDGLEGVVEKIDRKVLVEVMKPVQKAAESGKTKVLRKRAKAVLGDERLSDWMEENDNPSRNGLGLHSDNHHEGGREEWEGLGD